MTPIDDTENHPPPTELVGSLEDFRGGEKALNNLPAE